MPNMNSGQLKNIILVLFAITSISTKGQSLIGIKGGLNVTNVSSDIITENYSKNGFSGGLTFEYFFNNKYSISSDLILSQRGFTADYIILDEQGNPTGITNSVDFNYDYISLPIKTGIYLGEKVSGFGNIGLIPSILLSAKSKTASFEYDGQKFNGKTFDFTDRVNKFDLAGLIEIGINYKIKDKYWLFSSIAYQYSFTNTTNTADILGDKKKHYGLTMSLGIKYRLKEGHS